MEPVLRASHDGSREGWSDLREQLLDSLLSSRSSRPVSDLHASIQITTFSPDVDEETSNCVEAFIQEAGEGMAVSRGRRVFALSSRVHLLRLRLLLRYQNFTKLGVERVIIDTTDDGGGFIALSMLCSFEVLSLLLTSLDALIR